jgi:hypothetical protein
VLYLIFRLVNRKDALLLEAKPRQRPIIGIAVAMLRGADHLPC